MCLALTTLPPRIHLTILIPAYNEARRLPDTLTKIEQYCSSYLDQPYELLVVDDGSFDETSLRVRDLQKQIPSLVLHRYEKNHGKGYALRTGMNLAGGQFILFTDSDLSTPIEELPAFLKRLSDGDAVVIATRKNPEASILQRQSLWRESMGKAFTWLSNTILGLNVSDFTCGFKGFEKVAGKRIFEMQKVNRWAFDSEVLFLAHKLGYRIREVPVHWKNSPESKVRIVRDTISSLLALFLIRWFWLTGKYSTQ
jgi:dolichyl-phosphate beta-glucosyltransferase